MGDPIARRVLTPTADDREDGVAHPPVQHLEARLGEVAKTVGGSGLPTVNSRPRTVHSERLERSNPVISRLGVER